jgi:hypothetical protein
MNRMNVANTSTMVMAELASLVLSTSMDMSIITRINHRVDLPC